MNRREFLTAAGVAVGTALAGCLGGSTGTLATQIAPPAGDIGDFESCIVTITEIRVMPASADGTDGTETAAGQTIAAEEPVEGEEVYEVADAELDLVELRNGNAERIDERQLETGEYEYLKLVVSNVDATLEGGEGVEVATPNGGPLEFDATFDIQGETRTLFTAGFAPVAETQETEDGQETRYVLRPVADSIAVSYE